MLPDEGVISTFISDPRDQPPGLLSRTNGGDALIPVILDGENAWEHYEGGGRPFLRALYGALSSHHDLTMVTLTEGCAKPGDVLHGIFPGSWINGDFYIWIDHADDQRAWSQLGEARPALSRTSAHGSPAVPTCTPGPAAARTRASTS